MASGSAVPAATATAGSPSSSPSAWPSSTLSKCRRCTGAGRRRHTVSCRATGGRAPLAPRRGVLAGLTGLAAYPDFAAALAAEADPKEETYLRGDTFTGEFLDCKGKDDGAPFPCPPKPSIPDFNPPGTVPPRVRRPAHLMDQGSIDKYKEALKRMKQLAIDDPNDPRGFAQQAAIHQAYCDGHYKVAEATGDPTDKDAPFDVHFSGIFAPWHRMYIYFYERILGSLINDPDFALPYWNWDAPEGMALPKMFKDDCSPLYDEHRNPAHLNAYVNLDILKDMKKPPVKFDPQAVPAKPYTGIVKDNLCTLYKQMISEGKDATTFLGGKVCAGNKYDRNSGTSGTPESSKAHTSIHVWTGDPGYRVKGRNGTDYAGGDMGFLGSASRDPIFYSHHANVDRLWHLWYTTLGGKNFDDPEWLNTSFVFYDEKKQRVRCKVGDFLDTAALGYTYADDEPLLWRDSKLTERLADAATKEPTTSPSLPLSLPNPTVPKVKLVVPPPTTFPLNLREGQSVVVRGVARPPRINKMMQMEELVFDGVEFNPGEASKFDVAINVPLEVADDVGPRFVEYAGSFASLPRGGDDKPGAKRKVPLKLLLDDVLADIGVGTDETVNVVIVPRTPGITITSKPTIETRDRS
ncbi:hypothetical protein EJB05_09581, partial [Eragrostis curvula]